MGGDSGTTYCVVWRQLPSYGFDGDYIGESEYQLVPPCAGDRYISNLQSIGLERGGEDDPLEASFHRRSRLVFALRLFYNRLFCLESPNPSLSL
tara:strand:+ start:3048 stop:3329 length:282 start_codon:yes stop_codon:yes gene_type:complete